jgi:UvrD/REP helicase N-terminal domain
VAFSVEEGWLEPGSPLAEETMTGKELRIPYSRLLHSDSCRRAAMNSSYLAKLNPEQRRAAEYGRPSCNEAGPLLIIAGAGSGKTNTLAHRVAYLVTNGIDPRRIMLLTFSRRAATEMGRRVERIAASVIGSHASTVIHALTWSGTFHALGARLLREYAPQIGLDRSFTTLRLARRNPVPRFPQRFIR